MCDFFRCAARLVAMIYDLLLASILGVCGYVARVVFPLPYKINICWHVELAGLFKMLA
jgi:hypothetical protein